MSPYLLNFRRESQSVILKIPHKMNVISISHIQYSPVIIGNYTKFPWLKNPFLLSMSSQKPKRSAERASSTKSSVERWSAIGKALKQNVERETKISIQSLWCDIVELAKSFTTDAKIEIERATSPTPTFLESLSDEERQKVVEYMMERPYVEKIELSMGEIAKVDEDTYIKRSEDGYIIYMR